MSKAEADALVTLGKHWFAHVWLKNDATERNRIILHMNHDFLRMNLTLRVYKGWQPYDPVVKVGGKAHTYAGLVTWAASQQDGGVEVAKEFREWYGGAQLELKDLPPHLQAFAVITHFAEVARGYKAALKDFLYDWIDDIAAAKSRQDAIGLWHTYRDRFPPSMKYDEDAKKDWY